MLNENSRPQLRKSQTILTAPTSAGQYMPDPTTHPSGTNYFDETSHIIYVVIEGPSVVEIKFNPVVNVSVTISSLTVEGFNETSFID